MEKMRKLMASFVAVMMLVVIGAVNVVAIDTEHTPQSGALYSELVIYDDISQVPKSAVRPNGISVDTVRPYLIRSGNTEKVEVYLNYAGDTIASGVAFSSITISSTSLLWSKDYGVIKPDNGNSLVYGWFPAAVFGSARFGSVNIPIDVENVLVKTKGLKFYSMGTSSWLSMTNISGMWGIN